MSKEELNLNQRQLPKLLIRVCAYHCSQLLYITHYKTVLIIFPFILWTIIIARMLFTGGDGKHRNEIGTVSLLASSRCVGLNIPTLHCNSRKKVG